MDKKLYLTHKDIFLKKLKKIKSERIKYGKSSNLIMSRNKNDMNKLLKCKNNCVRRKLIKWRNNKLYTNFYLKEKNLQFSRYSFNKYIYQHLIECINTMFIDSYQKIINSSPHNLTIIDFLINKRAYYEANLIIDLCKEFIKKFKN